jgi:hypothetical protein
MGQRHQIYVLAKKRNNEGYEPLGAFHHQWKYGMGAVCDLTRAIQLISKAKFKYEKWCDFTCRDPREIATVITAIYGIDLKSNISMVHNCDDHLIVDGKIKPELGDNNDGCSIIVIDDEQNEVRGGFFTPGHVEGQHGRGAKKNHFYTRQEYLAFYYDLKEQKTLEFKKNFSEEIKIVESCTIAPIDQSELDVILGVKKPKKAAPKNQVEKPKKEALKIVPKVEPKLSKLEAYNARMARLGAK